MGKIPSFSTLLCGVVIGYICYSVWNVVQIFLPPKCSSQANCLKSFLHDNPQLDLIVYSSAKNDPSYDREVSLVSVVDKFNYLEPWEKSVTISIPKSTRNNGSLYLHCFCIPSSNVQSKKEFTKLFQRPSSVYFRVPLTKLHVPSSYIFNLLKEEAPKPRKTKADEIQNEARPVSHIRSKIGFNMVTDPLSLPVQEIPMEIQQLIRLSPSRTFLPIIMYNFLESRLEDLKEMKNDTEEVVLKYTPTNIGKVRFILHLELAMVSFKKMGFSSKDIDDVKGIFAGTNIYLLCGTIIIVSFHLLFDFLAFKNDVSFWRNKSNLEGLSSRTVLWRAFSQVVVLLYLYDEKATVIVLAPSGIATVIECWKAVKVLRRRRGVAVSETERKTDEYDAESMRYLSYLLYPLCLGGAIYSLFYQPHKSWYSWCIHSLVNGVYAFGFLFMLPQLFVNYRLKSVAALPWRAFMYKAFNTFIDDVFAFIITMPTAHRMACFRDDIIFLVYLYQRWLYPVDKSRLDETARALGEKGESVSEEKKKK